jgi:hypothetical protein
MTDPVYEKRYCAFIDILGFSELIQTLDKGVIAHMPTAEQQQKNKPVEPRFKIDHAASPMPKTRQPERLAPRATSNRNGGRDHLGILGEIKSVHPGEIIGIRTQALAPIGRRMTAPRGRPHGRDS